MSEFRVSVTRKVKKTQSDMPKNTFPGQIRELDGEMPVRNVSGFRGKGGDDITESGK